MTEPMTPADCDLRDFQYMPLDVVRLRDSETAVLASGDEFRAAVLLWCAAWHQVPAASLPNDDRLLANLAGYGRDMKGWKAVRTGALRGFVECSDGRLYHPVIAEKAIEATEKRRSQQRRTKAATDARANRNEQRDVERDVVGDDQRNDARNVVQGKGREGKGREKEKDAAPNGAQSAGKKTHEADLFERGKEVLGKNAGGMISELLRAKDRNIALARAAIETAATKQSPREYIGAIIRGADPPERTVDPRL